VKPLRIPPHTAKNFQDRDISRDEVELALAHPELVVPGYDSRQIYMRRYQDKTLGQEMLLRVIVEETENDRVVVSVYKTSRIERYLKGLT